MFFVGLRQNDNRYCYQKIPMPESSCIKLQKKSLREPKAITEYISMYPNASELSEGDIAQVAKNGYLIVIEENYFVITIPLS